MGEYQNPTYRGINNPSAGTQAFNSSFSTWFDKIFGAMMNQQKSAQAQQASIAKARQDFNKKYGDFRGNLYDVVVKNGHRGVTSSVNITVPKIAAIAKLQGWGDDQLRDVEASFTNQINHLNNLAGAAAGPDAIKWGEVDMSIEGAHEMKAIMDSMVDKSDLEIQEIFGVDFAADPTNLPEGVNLYSIFTKDLINPTNGEAVNSDTWGQWLQNIQAGEKTGSSNSQERTIASAVKLIEGTQKNRASLLSEELALDLNKNYDLTNEEHLGQTREDLVNLMDNWDGRGGVNHYIWANEGSKITPFEEGYEVMWNNGVRTLDKEMASMLNMLNYGDVQKAIDFHGKKGSVLDQEFGINPETYEKDNISEEGFNLESADYDIADFALTAQRSKIADYLMEHKVTPENVKNRKPVPPRKASQKDIKTATGIKLYDHYEADMSELMNVYTNEDRYTTDDVKLKNTGTSLRDFLIGKPIVAGAGKETILDVVLNDGILSIKVEMSRKSGELLTSSEKLFKYDLTQPNYNGFYELIGNLTAALDDQQVINENQRYDRIK